MSESARFVRTGFSAGIGWLTGGGELLAQGGRALIRIALVLLLISMLQLVPLIGVIVLALISPALTAGLLNVFSVVERRHAPSPATLLAGLAGEETRPGLLLLGAFLLVGGFCAVAVLVAWLGPQMDLEALARLAEDPETLNRNPEALFALFAGVDVLGGLVLSATIFALVLAALYFAVPLVFFWRWPVLVSLLWSLRAVVANWLAFLGFGLVAIGMLLLVGLVTGLLAGILSLALGQFGSMLATLGIAVVSLFVRLLLAAAQWRAFDEVFPNRPDRETVANSLDV